MIETRMNIDKVKFGKFIASRRKAISDNFTQKELAKILHVGTSAIGKIEAGETLPSFDLFIDLADALEMTPGELMMELAERSDTRKVILLPEDKEYILFPSYLSDSAKDDIKKFVKQKEVEGSPGRIMSNLIVETLEQSEELLDSASNEEDRLNIINERDQRFSIYDDILSKLGITLTFELPYTPEYFPRVFTFGFEKNGSKINGQGMNDDMEARLNTDPAEVRVSGRKRQKQLTKMVNGDKEIEENDNEQGKVS